MRRVVSDRPDIILRYPEVEDELLRDVIVGITDGHGFCPLSRSVSLPISELGLSAWRSTAIK